MSVLLFSASNLEGLQVQVTIAAIIDFGHHSYDIVRLDKGFEEDVRVRFFSVAGNEPRQGLSERAEIFQKILHPRHVDLVPVEGFREANYEAYPEAID